MTKRLVAEHGIICAWPARSSATSAGPRSRASMRRARRRQFGPAHQHVCRGQDGAERQPDDGRTGRRRASSMTRRLTTATRAWSISGVGEMLISWFTSDTRQYRHAKWCEKAAERTVDTTLNTWTDELVRQWSARGQAERRPGRDVERAAPRAGLHAARADHAGNGGSAVLGQGCVWDAEGRIMAARSRDDGRTWTVPAPCRKPGPRCRSATTTARRRTAFRNLSAWSASKRCPTAPAKGDQLQPVPDRIVGRGATWSAARPTGVYGSPPHLLRHSSGALIASMVSANPATPARHVSRDDGVTWEATGLSAMTSRQRLGYRPRSNCRRHG